MTRANAGALLLSLVLLWLVPAPSSGVAAQEEGPDATAATDPRGEPADEGVALRLIDQSLPVQATGTFRLRVAVEGDVADVIARIHRPVNGRIQFLSSISGEQLGNSVHSAEPVIPSGAEAEVVVPLNSDLPGSASLDREGVYPVSVEARSTDGTVLATLVTHLVVLPPPTDTSPRLLVAPVMSLAQAPGLEPDGTVSFTAEDLARLDTVAGALAAHPDVPLTFRVVPETLLSLGLGDGDQHSRILDDLALSRAGRSILPWEFVRVDVGAWLAAGLDDELGNLSLRGDQVLADLLGDPIDRTTALVDEHTTEATLRRLRESGVSRLVPLAGWTDDSSTREQPARAPSIVTGYEEMRIMPVDPVLRDELADDTDPILAAHQSVATLMVHYFDLPGTQRGEVMVLAEDLLGEPGYLETILAALDQGARLGAVDLAELDATVLAEQEPVLLDHEFAPAGLVGSIETDLTSARADTEALESTFPGGAWEITPGSGVTNDDLLLTATSVDLTADEREEYLSAATAALEATRDGVNVPDGQTVTLTARTADVPLVIENSLSRAVQVEISFTSEKLSFPEGPTRTLTLDPGVNRLDVTVETRASGAFPMDVELLTPKGGLVLSRARMRIRSTAISGVGLVLSIGAGIFLVIWWGRHWRSTRRSRRLISPSHPAGRGMVDPRVAAARALLDADDGVGTVVENSGTRSRGDQWDE